MLPSMEQTIFIVNFITRQSQPQGITIWKDDEMVIRLCMKNQLGIFLRILKPYALSPPSFLALSGHAASLFSFYSLRRLFFWPFSRKDRATFCPNVTLKLLINGTAPKGCCWLQWAGRGRSCLCGSNICKRGCLLFQYSEAVWYLLRGTSWINYYTLLLSRSPRPSLTSTFASCLSAFCLNLGVSPSYFSLGYDSMGGSCGHRKFLWLNVSRKHGSTGSHCLCLGRIDLMGCRQFSSLKKSLGNRLAAAEDEMRRVREAPPGPLASRV